MPTPVTIAGKAVRGQIIAKDGQVIENVHVKTSSGSCIVVKGVRNVTIRDSEIGPCGAPGNVNSHGIVTIGASNVTIRPLTTLHRVQPRRVPLIVARLVFRRMGPPLGPFPAAR